MSDGSYISTQAQTQVLSEHFYEASSLNDVVEFSFSLKQNSVEYATEDIYYVQGYLDIHPNGYGVLRKNGFIPDGDDTYLTSALVKKHNLKKGQYISGRAKHILAGKPKIMYEIEDIDNNKKVFHNHNSHHAIYKYHKNLLFLYLKHLFLYILK